MEKTSTAAPTARRTDEWDSVNEIQMKYQLSQWDNTKQSTRHFELFIQTPLQNSRQVIDLASGAGGATAYIAARNPGIEFIGIDYSAELVSIGNRLKEKKSISNLHFRTGDWFNLSGHPNVDGVISLQTLSWLPEFQRPLTEIFEKISPRWIAISSLFYEGDISCKIEVNEHRDDSRYFYNVYSIPAVGRLCEANGYKLTKHSKFNIDIDIPKPENMNIMGTYTVLVAQNQNMPPERLQVSGPLLMNWYSLLIERQI